MPKFIYKIVVLTDTKDESKELDDALVFEDDAAQAAADALNADGRQAPWLVGVLSDVNGVLTGTIHGSGTSHPPLNP